MEISGSRGLAFLVHGRAVSIVPAREGWASVTIDGCAARTVQSDEVVTVAEGLLRGSPRARKVVPDTLEYLEVPSNEPRFPLRFRIRNLKEIAKWVGLLRGATSKDSSPLASSPSASRKALRSNELAASLLCLALPLLLAGFVVLNSPLMPIAGTDRIGVFVASVMLLSGYLFGIQQLSSSYSRRPSATLGEQQSEADLLIRPWQPDLQRWLWRHQDIRTGLNLFRLQVVLLLISLPAAVILTA